MRRSRVGRRELIDQILVSRAFLKAVTAEDTGSFAAFVVDHLNARPITTKPFSDQAMVVATLEV